MKKIAVVLSFVLLAAVLCISMVGCENNEKTEDYEFYFKYADVETSPNYSDQVHGDPFEVYEHYLGSSMKVSIADDKITLQFESEELKGKPFTLGYEIKYGILTTEEQVYDSEYNISTTYYQIYDNTLVYVTESAIKQEGPELWSITRIYFKNFQIPEVADNTVDVEGNTFYCDPSTMIYDQSEAVEGDNAETELMLKYLQQVFSAAEITFSEGVVRITNFSQDSDVQNMEFTYVQEGNVLTLTSFEDVAEDEAYTYNIYLREDGLTFCIDFLRISNAFWFYIQADFVAR